MENLDLYDYKRLYPQTVDYIDELVERGFKSFAKTLGCHKEELVSIYIEEDEDALCLMPDLNKLIRMMIAAPGTVYSTNNKIVAFVLKNKKELFETIFEMIKEQQKRDNAKTQFDELSYHGSRF